MRHFSFFHLPLIILFFQSQLCLYQQALAAPLSTNSRWIVDESGKRVKLACINWVSHLEPMLAEGLSKQPLDSISKTIAYMGFNCVRLTWPTFLVTNASYSSVTVNQSFQALNLTESIAAMQINNPSILNLKLTEAYKTVVSNLGENNIMVILDNHISKPGWCCSNNDGNGFFGDRYFDPNVWVDGLTKMATMFNGTSNVVGMSLRNELRGPRQNISDWYRYMQRGAEAVHAANPNVLIILSGLSFDNDLSFLSSRQVNVSFTGKIVFELHWYSFSNSQEWSNGNVNQVCGRISGNVLRKGGFLVSQGWPLFLSEFGVDQRGVNVNDNRYFGCILGFAADLDLDFAFWTLQGSYYLRQGVYNLNEAYGVLDWGWCNIRNASMLQRVQALQQPFGGPGYTDSKTYAILFHPSTGLCVSRRSLLQPFELGPCNQTEPWTYTAQHTLKLQGTLQCLRAEGSGSPAKLGIICSDAQSKWELISDSKMHLSVNVSSSLLCLDIGDDGRTVVTNPCKCLSRDQSCDPESQWFRLVNSTRTVTRSRTSPLKNLHSMFSRWKLM